MPYVPRPLRVPLRGVPRALYTLVSQVPRVLRAHSMHALVPHVVCTLCAIVPYVPCALRISCLTCFKPHVFRALHPSYANITFSALIFT